MTWQRSYSISGWGYGLIFQEPLLTALSCVAQIGRNGRPTLRDRDGGYWPRELLSLLLERRLRACW